MEKLKCSVCGYEMEMPQHCGKLMHKEKDQLVCHMGAHCGAQPIPEHCSEQMNVV
ncbi:MAG: hypothetical protein ACFFD7_14975 [Candidatus Thorarchaeota archaeon]